MREAMEATEPASVEQTLTQKQEITYECCLSHVGALFRAYSSHLFEALTRILETPSCACDGLFSALSLTLLSFALNVKGFEVGVVYAVWSGVGMAFIVTIEIIWQQREQWNGKDIGPIGTMARIGLGLGFVGSVVHGQLATRLAPASLPTRD